ncbi:AraC family transcriptional regulator of adaptative response / DNA-3-methyladenine glycosylase II [Agromyces flavus]|uniref:DNA-3-methyladenine glycosylase II n=1 Tax=Agromyces flavus TaxID=589382 RepID=A0A1H1TFY5_9MICO|nr:AlkA N-terminal domain-containing protein [Agromyces flavus]MCP2368430.1 AraC family transcriptional regulator of adaptative response / DNA-3-methyladenine glycosylase II [Agromyces flavus]GGI47890.1 DNA-3-methyladenine glycosylase [Agromyces flavus]SDS59173.1 DNA-3-methyladenine glycosylase II [Agromyces flavus]
MTTMTAEPTADPLADPAFAERYRAMLARDDRFDGWFITGVHSTGIYCRPSCPAAPPKPSNVTFYRTAAAAHEAGLRACKRCLPDAVPGSPEWDLGDDLAARAMRLIADGVVERDGVPGLAARLGYTPRHLTRVLAAELGAGPLALARAHRAQTARALLTSTSMRVADVAFASGFGSIRQFNDTIRAVYERSPLELRATARRATPVADAGTVRLRLPARAPFDAAGVFAWLGDRALAGVEEAGPTHYERTLALPSGPALVRLAAVPDSPALDVEARLASLTDLAPLVARVRRLFDLDADATAIDAALAADPVLAPSIAATPGLRMPGTLDPHELVVRALIGQQVSVAAARTALTRLAAELGERVEFDGRTRTLFPPPEAIAEHGAEVLRGPATRIRTIVDVSTRLATGELVVAAECERAQLRADLLAIPGIGPWTAGYLAMRVTREPDELLVSDLALRNGAVRLGLPGDAKALAAHGERWAPWRSYASMHLWRAAASA